VAATDETRLREGQRVFAAADRPGVPAGTPGKVVTETGIHWLRYRVRFANGVELNLLDRRYLSTEAPAGEGDKPGG
jgi:hypothetical protein